MSMIWLPVEGVNGIKSVYYLKWNHAKMAMDGESDTGKTAQDINFGNLQKSWIRYTCETESSCQV